MHIGILAAAAHAAANNSPFTIFYNPRYSCKMFKLSILLCDEDNPISFCDRLWQNTFNYNRASPSEFVIPLAKYNKAMYTQVSLGMRFRMMFETEESGVRRYMGTITGISDLDTVRWKNSQWRNLQVFFGLVHWVWPFLFCYVHMSGWWFGFGKIHGIG